MHTRTLRLARLAVANAAICFTPLAAQCANAWFPGAAPFDDSVTSSTVWDPDGIGPQVPRIVVGGGFGELGGGVPNRIASFDPVAQAWVPVGSGLGQVAVLYHGVTALTTLPNGELVAGGSFTTPSLAIARFNGTTWVAVPGCPIYPVYALARRANGHLLVGGSGGVAEWDGAAWTTLGAVSGSARAVLEQPNGNVLAGGQFSAIGGVAADNLASFDGTSWTPRNVPAPGWVSALLLHSSGDVIVGGGFAFLTPTWTLAQNVVRLTSTGWQELGNGVGSFAGGTSVLTLAELPDGDIVAGGSFAGGVARYTGASWSPFGAGVGGFPSNTVYTLTMQPDGQLAVGGRFTNAGGAPSPYFAWLRTSCPATAVAAGSGCASSGGNNSLVATALPWVDATFRAQGSGLPGNAVVIATTSFLSIPQGLLPLSSVFPQAQPGCDLLVAPDIVQIYATSTGSLESSFFLPSTPPIVGLTFFHQQVPFEVSAGTVTAVTATNALQLTAGQF